MTAPAVPPPWRVRHPRRLDGEPWAVWTGRCGRVAFRDLYYWTMPAFGWLYGAAGLPGTRLRRELDAMAQQVWSQDLRQDP